MLPDTETVPARRTYSYLGPGRDVHARLSRRSPRRAIRSGARCAMSAKRWPTSSRDDRMRDDRDRELRRRGVSTAQDALATVPGLRIVGEYLVPVNFVLVGRPGDARHVSLVAAHPVAYGQCLGWLSKNLPAHAHLPAERMSRVRSACWTARVPPTRRSPPPDRRAHDLSVLAENIATTPRRDALRPVSRTGRAGASDRGRQDLAHRRAARGPPGCAAGAARAVRHPGINLSLLASRPIGRPLGRYRFVIDADGTCTTSAGRRAAGSAALQPEGHLPRSYRARPRDRPVPAALQRRRVRRARDWLRGLLSGEPEA